MALVDIINKVSKTNYVIPYKDVWYGIFLRISLYTKGIKPNYCIDVDDFYRTASRREETIAEPYTDIFDTEIFSRYPHDSNAQLNFRKSIASIDDMKSICDKFFEQSKSILFQGNNFQINTEDKKLKEWIENVRIDGFHFREWVKNVLYANLIDDPNAWLAVIESHKTKLLPSEYAKPMPVIVNSYETMYADDETLVTNSFAIDKFSQILYDKFKVETFIPYTHNIGMLPAVQLGGKYVKQFIWHSFIQSFVGIANCYIQEKSDSVIAKKTLAPRLQIIESNCATCNGSGKLDTAEGPKNCEKCRGKGKITMNLGDVVGVPEATIDMDGKGVNSDRFKYTTPDPAYINLLSNDADKEFARAEKALFLFRKETSASESANNLDKQFEEKKIFFQAISERLYYLMTEILVNVSKYLNYNNGTPKSAIFTIDKPLHFDLASADDLIVQYANEKKNLLPATITNNSELAYVKKIFGDDATILKKVEFLQLYDPLYGITNLTNNAYDQIDLVKHNYLGQLLELYVREIGENQFSTMSYQDVYKAIEPGIIAKNDALPQTF